MITSVAHLLSTSWHWSNIKNVKNVKDILQEMWEIENRVNCNHLVHWAWPSSDAPMGCLPVTCQVPIIANIILWLHSGDTLHIVHMLTECESDKVSFSCNWYNLSKVSNLLFFAVKLEDLEWTMEKCSWWAFWAIIHATSFHLLSHGRGWRSLQRWLLASWILACHCSCLDEKH